MLNAQEKAKAYDDIRSNNDSFLRQRITYIASWIFVLLGTAFHLLSKEKSRLNTIAYWLMCSGVAYIFGASIFI